MSAYTFDGHSAVCPICHGSKRMRLDKSGSGLYMCPYCQERFVVSQSGHYVRDPVPVKPRADSQMLRRQSRPLARMRRDFSLGKHAALLAIMGSAIFLGLSLATLELKPQKHNPLQDVWNWMTKTVEWMEF